MEGRIGGDLTNTVLVGHLYRFDVDGAVAAGIDANVSSIGFFHVECGSVATTGNLVSARAIERVRTIGNLSGPVTATSTTLGDIADITVGGNLRGDITAGNLIDKLDVTGDIGTSSDHVTIFSGHIIGTIGCARAWADVSTSGSGGRIHRIQTNASSGAFVGSISTDHMDYVGTGITSGFSINGNLDADVTFTRYAAAPLISITGTFPAGRTLRIGEGFYTGDTGQNRTMSFGSLGGQVIINASNPQPPAPPFDWTGNITVNGTSLATRPYYSNTSSSIGGGSVGLVPYHLHDEDCVPANGHVGGTPLDSVIRLEWYGPLSWNPASGDPVTVKYYNGSGWVDITTDFDFAISSTNPRRLEITPEDMFMDWNLMPYRIQPTSNLKCGGGVTGTPPVFPDDIYEVDFE